YGWRNTNSPSTSSMSHAMASRPTERRLQTQPIRVVARLPATRQQQRGRSGDGRAGSEPAGPPAAGVDQRASRVAGETSRAGQAVTDARCIWRRSGRHARRAVAVAEAEACVGWLAGCPGVGNDLGAVDEHVELLADVNPMVGPVDGVEDLQHPRIDPL